MAYQVLARKYRPKRFSEVHGQEHISLALGNAIKNHKIAQAYLFTGTRGVGKTSVARIFAKTLCCSSPTSDFSPCLTCRSCVAIDDGSSLDYLEVDGASHNSVENIRKIIEGANYLPTEGKYKVFVIDEVHMLSTSAFNALLKTLEEPPAHAIFILATTDPEKIPVTVLSRCQRFDFRPVSIKLLKKVVSDISLKENFSFSSERILDRLCDQGRGSVRDTLSLLDQVLCLSIDGKITDETLRYALGITQDHEVQNIWTLVLSAKVSELTKSFVTIYESGVDLKLFAHQLLNTVYEDVQHKIGDKSNSDSVSIPELMWIYETLEKDLRWAMESFDVFRTSLLVLQKVCLRRELLGNITIESLESSEAVEEPTIPEKKIEKRNLLEGKNWEGLQAHIKNKNPALFAYVERGNLITPFELNGDSITLKLGFNSSSEMFKDYLDEKETHLMIEHVIADYFEVGEDQINLVTALVDDNGVKSIVDIEQEIKQQELDKKKEELLKNQFVQQAEQIFGAKVDKWILKDTP